MTWKTESFTDVDGNKDREFVRFIDLPARAGARFELAVNGPHELLRAHGWSPLDAMRVSRTTDGYRDFIQGSKAEFGVAKHAYVARRSGWFSDRTACYLAAGRPAVVQETGWSAHLPSGTGLIPFSTVPTRPTTASRVSSGTTRRTRRQPRGSPVITSTPGACCRRCSSRPPPRSLRRRTRRGATRVRADSQRDRKVALGVCAAERP